MLSAIFCAVPAPMRVEPAMSSGGVASRIGDLGQFEQRRAGIVGDGDGSSRRAGRPPSARRRHRASSRWRRRRSGSRLCRARRRRPRGPRRRRRPRARRPDPAGLRRRRQRARRCARGGCRRCREVRAHRPAPSGRNCRPPRRRACRRLPSVAATIAAASAIEPMAPRTAPAASTCASARKPSTTAGGC